MKLNFCEQYKYLTDENNIFKEINYDELKDILDSFKTGLILVGGPWHNKCQSIMKETNDICKREGLEEVFVYNPKFVNVFKEEEDLRDCLTLENKLKYYYIIEHTGYKSDNLVKDTLIAKMNLPTFLAIKNGNCVKYYTPSLIKDSKDPFLHEEGSLEDKTLEFDAKLTELCKAITDEKNRFL